MLKFSIHILSRKIITLVLIYLQGVNIFVGYLILENSKRIWKLVYKNVDRNLLIKLKVIEIYIKERGDEMTWCATLWRGDVTKIKLSHSFLRLASSNAKLHLFRLTT